MAVRKPYIGQLDRKIKIYKQLVVKDAVGQEKMTKELFASAYSKLENDYGNAEIDMAVMHEVTRMYIIRWRSEIEKEGVKMLIEDNGNYYNVISVSPIGRKSHLLIKCSYEQ